MSRSTSSPWARPVPADVGDSHLDRAVGQVMRRHRIPSMAAAVVSPARVEHLVAHGSGDLAAQEPATAQTAYAWFSMTKLVTATAAMRLADEGRLDLDAPFEEYVPSLRRGSGRGATTRQLLTHTAGLANPLPLRWVHSAGRPGPQPVELLEELLQRRRAFRQAPGGRARYTNVGYLAVGEVVTAAAGMPYTAYVQQAVLEPAGMSGAGFTYGQGSAATGYVRAPRVIDPVLDAFLPAGIPGDRHGPWRALNRFYVDGPAYGGLLSDIGDAARFARLHLDDGEGNGRRVLAPATARAMRAVEHPGTPFDHGVGWFRRPAGRAGGYVEHLGAGAGFFNLIRLHPGRRVALVVMANTTAQYDVEPLWRAAVEQRWS